MVLKINKFGYWGAVLIFIGAGLIISGCSEDSPTNNTNTDHTFLSLPFPSDSAFAEVVELLVVVTAPNIGTPLTATHTVDHNQSYAVIEIDVPAGANRHFSAYGVTADTDTTYWANVTVAIASGQRNDVAAMLVPINQGVTIYVPYPSEPLFEYVSEMKVTVTGVEMPGPITSTQTVDHDQNSLIFNLAVPAGADRNFDIVGLNSIDQYLYRAQLVANISDSHSTNLTLALTQLGYGQATRVRIFRNVLPWGLADLDSLLQTMSFTQGAGDNQYQVFNSTLMGSILLVPGRDLVIFEGWQDTAFYNDYMSAREYFESFIDSGGSVLLMANEGGVHGWYYDSTGMQFPGGVTFIEGTSGFNRLVNPDHAIVAGMADSIAGDAASHGGLDDLPPGALTLTRDSGNRPTLICFSRGKGLVMMSTHPLEYLYNHRNIYTAGTLLSRIVRFMLGMDPTPDPRR